MQIDRTLGMYCSKKLFVAYKWSRLGVGVFVNQTDALTIGQITSSVGSSLKSAWDWLVDILDNNAFTPCPLNSNGLDQRSLKPARRA
jgi:hypothetical protein